MWKRYSRRFQPGEGPSRGLLRDCTTSPINRFAALIKSAQPSDDWEEWWEGWRDNWKLSQAKIINTMRGGQQNMKLWCGFYFPDQVLCFPEICFEKASTRIASDHLLAIYHHRTRLFWVSYHQICRCCLNVDLVWYLLFIFTQILQAE